MNLSELTSKSESWTADLFNFSDSGVSFRVFAKRSPSDIRTGRVGIYLKAAKERAVTLTKLDERFSVEAAIDFVKTECLSVEGA